MPLCEIESPLGPLTLVHDLQHVLELRFGRAPATEVDRSSLAANVRRQVEEYFEGLRERFDLPLETRGTPFQQRVWEELCRIPYGSTTSYGELARRLGSDGASRAVGLANARNPIAILIPCHRVIGASGSLTGYAGGLPIKEALLDFEREVARHGPRTFELSQPSLL